MSLILTLPIVVADRDAFSALFLTGSGPIVGFRPDPTSLIVSVDVGAFLLEDYGQPTVAHVTRFVEDVLHGRY